MNGGSVRQADSGELQLVGTLDYRTGPAVREAGRRLIRASQQANLVLDCAAVEKSSSVGLSLLLCYMRDARAAGKQLSVRGLPQDMSGIAKVCELQHVLPIPA